MSVGVYASCIRSFASRTLLPSRSVMELKNMPTTTVGRGGISV